MTTRELISKLQQAAYYIGHDSPIIIISHDGIVSPLVAFEVGDKEEIKLYAQYVPEVSEESPTIS